MLVPMGRPRKGDRITIAAKPERPLGVVIQRNADLLGMSYGDYLVLLAAHSLAMPEYAPQPTKTLDTLDGLAPDPAPIASPPAVPAPAAARARRALTTAEELRTRIAS